MTRATRIFIIVLLCMVVASLLVFWQHNRLQAQLNFQAHQAAIHQLQPGSPVLQQIAIRIDNIQYWGTMLYALTGCVLLAGLMEYIVLPVLSVFRPGAIVRVTFYEALFQPFTILVLLVGVALIVITAFVPFNTFGDDTKLYRDVAMSFALMFTLVTMVFATGKVVDEEIENRTMLTLMSKPIARWQVVLGKFFGVVCLVFFLMSIMTIVAAACSFLRYFDDMRMDFQVASNSAKAALYWANEKGVLALIPSMVLEFMEVCTLAAISMAIATRFSLVMNMTVIIVLYLGANLTRFVPLLRLGNPWQPMANATSYLLPYLGNFDVNQALVYRQFTLGHEFIRSAPSYGQIWEYVGLASLYGVLYIGVGLSLAVAMFRNRELT